MWVVGAWRQCKLPEIFLGRKLFVCLVLVLLERFLFSFPVGNSIECKTISLNWQSSRCFQRTRLFSGCVCVCSVEQGHGDPVSSIWPHSFIEQWQQTRSQTIPIRTEWNLIIVDVVCSPGSVLFLLLFYCLAALSLWVGGVTTARTFRGPSCHCNLSHTLWKHVRRHFYHFRIYMVSAWAASKLRSGFLPYCPWDSPISLGDHPPLAILHPGCPGRWNRNRTSLSRMNCLGLIYCTEIGYGLLTGSKSHSNTHIALPEMNDRKGGKSMGGPRPKFDKVSVFSLMTSIYS